MLAARHRARLIMQDRNIDLQEGTRLRNVRRRLFQDNDEELGEQRQDLRPGVDENNMNRIEDEIRQQREAAKKRWNFDFEKEEPLPGRYEWVKLDQDSNEIPSEKEPDNQDEKQINGELKEDTNEAQEDRPTDEESESKNGL